MATPYEKPVSATKSSELEDIKNIEDDERTMEANGCGCFRSLSWLRLPGTSGGSYAVLLEKQKDSSRENCLAKMGKKLTKMKCRVLVDGMRKKKRMEFRYDMQSYALNFDDGIDREVDGVRVCFSTPFCSINEGLGHQRVEVG